MLEVNETTYATKVVESVPLESYKSFTEIFKDETPILMAGNPIYEGDNLIISLSE